MPSESPILSDLERRLESKRTELLGLVEEQEQRLRRLRSRLERGERVPAASVNSMEAHGVEAALVEFALLEELVHAARDAARQVPMAR